MNELDQTAWERWVAYRVAIRKPIKTASEHAMKLKLSRYGADQDAVVNQSISNQWQGLFELKDKKKPDRPQKSPEQRAADDAMFIAGTPSRRAQIQPSAWNGSVVSLQCTCVMRRRRMCWTTRISGRWCFVCSARVVLHGSKSGRRCSRDPALQRLRVSQQRRNRNTLRRLVYAAQHGCQESPVCLHPARHKGGAAMTRTCKQCGQKFFGASSILQHRSGACGGEELLRSRGWVKTKVGWVSPQRAMFDAKRRGV